MVRAPQFSLGPRDRLWMVLQSHLGEWTSWSNLMFEAGFVTTPHDRVTAYTSFHWHLEQLKRSAGRDGFFISEQACHVMLSRVPNAVMSTRDVVALIEGTT